MLTETSGGLMTVLALPQIVYLDFDGELTSYNGEILTIDEVAVEDSKLTKERIDAITKALNEQFASQNVCFLSDKSDLSDQSDYSTIYIGKTTAFEPYGSFAGLAETVDSGNKNKSDKAFVMLDETNDDAQIIETIAHETSHLIGTLDHGGECLLKYAYGYVVSSGVTSTGIFLYYHDSMYVSSGGTANSTTVNGYWTTLYVSSGGTANSTTVNYRGYLYVSSGGTANSTTVNSGGYLYVSSGGTATISFNPWQGNVSSDTGACVTYLERNADVYYGGYENLVSKWENACSDITINSGYSAIIYSGGTADSITVNDYGDLYVSSGGTALSIKENGGYVSIYSNENVTFAANSFDGLSLYRRSATLHSGTTANSTTVDSWGHLYVFNGGTANSTTVNSSGWMHVDGGTANCTTVNDWGNLYVSGGGTANSTTVNANGNLTVSNGGMANSTTVNYRGYLYVSSGGTALLVKENGGYVSFDSDANVTFVANSFDGLVLSGARASATLHSGTTANSTTVNGRGNMYVSSGGTANSTTVNDGWLEVYSGGTANSTTVNSGGRLYVSSGGTANSTTVNSCGNLRVSSGGTANSTTVTDGGLYVSSGGTANGTTVNHGYLYVSSGGTANSTTVNDGWLEVYSGGEANSTTVNGGQLKVYGGTANSTTVNSGGGLDVSSGGTANSTTINSFGDLYVTSGGTANSTTVNSWGDLYVASGGTANSTTVNDGGCLYVRSGGTANCTTVNGKYYHVGCVYVSSGGTATISFNPWREGSVFLAEGADVTRLERDAEVYYGFNEAFVSKWEKSCSGLMINSGYSVIVYSGGEAKCTTVNSGGNLHVLSGGTATISFNPWLEGNVILTEGADVTRLERDAEVYYGFNEAFVSKWKKSCSGLMINSGYSVIVYSGGETNSTTVNYGGNLYVSSGGTVSDTIISGGSLYVESDGTAGILIDNPWNSFAVVSSSGAIVTSRYDAQVYLGQKQQVASKGSSFANVTVSSGVSMLLLSDGMTNNTIINTNGKVFISSGGTANDTILNGDMYVSRGGTAENATINSSGYLHILSGGMANNTIVSNGVLQVSSGGTALSIKENGGYVSFDSNTNVTFAANSFDGLILNASYRSATLHSGTTANSTTITGGNLYVLCSGIANLTTINGDYWTRGYVKILSGGIANNTTVNGNGWLQIFSGGTANSTTITGGNLCVSSGGTASDTIVSGGSLYVENGGTAGILIDNPWSSVDVVSASGAVVSSRYDAQVYLGQNQQVVSRGSAFANMTITSGFSMLVCADGVVSDTIISGGSLYVENGGTAGILIDNPWSSVDVVSSSGAVVTSRYDVQVYLGQNQQVISKGSVLSNLTVSSGMSMLLLPNGMIENITVNPSVNVYVSSSCMANSTVVKGYLYISSGGMANSTTVDTGGNLSVSSGGAANYTIINDGGNLYVQSGGSATISFNPWQGNVISAEGADVTRLERDADVYYGYNEAFVSKWEKTCSGLMINSGYSAIIYSGSTVNTTTVNSYGNLHVSSGGTANNTTVNFRGSLYVSSGGKVDNTFVRSGGSLYVENGGTAGILIDNPWSSVDVVSSSGAVVSSRYDAQVYLGQNQQIISKGSSLANITVTGGMSMLLLSNGVTDSTSVNAGGNAYVSSGGTANSTTVNAGGNLYVSSGGAALAVKENGGCVSVASGAAVSFVSNAFSGLQLTSRNATVHSGTTAVSTTLSPGGLLTIFNCGLADQVSLNGGTLQIGNGGRAENIMQNSGTINIDRGGVASNITYNSGTLSIVSGGIVRGMEWNNGHFQLGNGMIASDVKIAPDASATITSGGSAYNWTVSAFGTLNVASGGAAWGVNVHSSAACAIDKGYVSGLNLESRGSAAVTNARIDNILMGSSARVNIFASGRSGAVYSSSVVSGGTVGSNAVAFFRLNTVASSLNVSKAGMLYIDNGGTACLTTIDRMGRFALFGTAVSTFLSGGSMYIGDSSMRGFDSTGGSVTSNKYENDLVASYNVLSSSWLHVYSGGSAQQNIVNSNSWLHVYHGGSAIETEVNSSGYIVAQDSGTIDSAVVHSGGYMRLAAGATLNGMISIGGEMAVSGAGTSASEDVIRAYGADINYLLTERTTSDGAIITNLGMIQGATFYATVSENQAGQYCLADNAQDFTGYISIQDTEGTELAYCSIGETSDSKYKLSRSGNLLYLTIAGAADTEKPVISNIRQNISAPTMGNVIVTADFSDNVGVTLKQYRINDGQWITYADGVTMTQNGTITFRAYDAAKNETTATYSVTNIQETAGNASGVSWCNFSGSQYRVTFSKSAGSGQLVIETGTRSLDLYELNSGTWQWKVQNLQQTATINGNEIKGAASTSPQTKQSDADGVGDVFFGSASEVWGSRYRAQHLGVDSWSGTKELVALAGKNQITDVFSGSTDANILVLTDDGNGDALFLDDVYSAFPAEQKARLSQIDEIRAGAGNDIVDLTSQQFAYDGGDMTIRGGDGDDILWANKGENMLFGDSGNDRLVGCFNDDLLVGGIGDDSMNGGGGDDIFCFCKGWGKDTVEQLANGTVTLWFDSQTGTWDQATMTYSDGTNSVKVSGVSNVTLKFGDDGSEQYDELAAAGAFMEASSFNIFEEENKGIIAKM